MNPRLMRVAIAMAAGWIAMFAVVGALRPLMPVDETRYMSVAWEMLVQHNWFLPTLNFEPYSHKPPLLFWLINIAWAIGGVHVWPARVVTFLITATFVWFSGKLARRVFPRDQNADIYAMLAIGAMPAFLVYGSVIMFDTLMGVCVLAAVMMIWQQGLSDERPMKGWIWLGLAIGIGVLAKGPVALAYILPPALLAPVWAGGITRRWYAGLGVAVAVGAAIALAWAIPAVLRGGAEYADKIFITQSAGRMINANDHARPVWFYIGVLAAYLAPFILWPSLWRGFRHIRPVFKADAGVRFIACWVLPVVVFFSLISSKQFHYMTPVIPGFAVLIGVMIARAGIIRVNSLVLPMLAMLAPSIAIIAFEILNRPFPRIPLGDLSGHFAYLHILIAGVIAWWSLRKPERALAGLSMAALLLAVMMHVQLGQRFLPRYDFMAIRDAIAPYRDRPMAVAPKYDGEYGYALRLTHKVDVIDRNQMEDWFVKNPDGVIVVRWKVIPKHFDVLHQQPFRADENLLILQRLTLIGMK